MRGPVVVMGVGGSGTRVLVRVLEALGVFMGDNQNKAGEQKAIPCTPDRFAPFAEEMTAKAKERGLNAWGWKGPRWERHLDALYEALPQAKFVHIWRDARDMAYSNSLMVLAKRLKVDGAEARRQLYLDTQERLRSEVLKRFGIGRIYDASLERFCDAPRLSCHALSLWLGMPDLERIAKAAKIPQGPPHRGRYKDYGDFIDD